MDVSSILEAQRAKEKSVLVEKETPLILDAGHLMVTDLNPIDEESYNENLEDHLQSLARDGVQALIGKLFSLPTTSTDDGPLAQLPPQEYLLPRSKPLPKPKPQTKWEAFAAAKGIQHKKRDRKVFDEEKQEWVNRWGKDGKNKEKETQWLTEVPSNADADYNPQLEARKERKERIAKNERQKMQNIARAAREAQSARKEDIDRTLATSRTSTASMGKFDKKLEGEKKLRGVKRKFEPNELPTAQEKKNQLDLISRMDSDSRKMRKTAQITEPSEINVRKAVKFASKGKGSLGLAGGRDKKGGKPRGKPGKR